MSSASTPRAVPTNPHLSNLATAIDKLLRAEGRPGVVETVLEAAASDVAWRELAHRVRDYTGIRVSHESLRVWHEEWAREVAA